MIRRIEFLKALRQEIGYKQRELSPLLNGIVEIIKERANEGFTVVAPYLLSVHRTFCPSRTNGGGFSGAATNTIPDHYRLRMAFADNASLDFYNRFLRTQPLRIGLAQLSHSLQNLTGESANVCDTAIDCFFSVIKQAIVDKETVHLSGFGKIVFRQRQRGEGKLCAAIPFFKPSKSTIIRKAQKVAA